MVETFNNTNEIKTDFAAMLQNKNTQVFYFDCIASFTTGCNLDLLQNIFTFIIP